MLGRLNAEIGILQQSQDITTQLIKSIKKPIKRMARKFRINIGLINTNESTPWLNNKEFNLQ